MGTIEVAPNAERRHNLRVIAECEQRAAGSADSGIRDNMAAFGLLAWALSIKYSIYMCDD
jgi:hypothetical protein